MAELPSGTTAISPSGRNTLTALALASAASGDSRAEISRARARRSSSLVDQYGLSGQWCSKNSSGLSGATRLERSIMWLPPFSVFDDRAAAPRRPDRAAHREGRHRQENDGEAHRLRHVDPGRVGQIRAHQHVAEEISRRCE